uniref:Uncharacterized protein n=1 Tax=Glossina austeni TaxID=7395 RepID=A0A1A9UUK5_GLOAU
MWIKHKISRTLLSLLSMSIITVINFLNISSHSSAHIHNYCNCFKSFDMIFINTIGAICSGACTLLAVNVRYGNPKIQDLFFNEDRISGKVMSIPRQTSGCLHITYSVGYNNGHWFSENNRESVDPIFNYPMTSLYCYIVTSDIIVIRHVSRH